jgi:hypothetical protein
MEHEKNRLRHINTRSVEPKTSQLDINVTNQSKYAMNDQVLKIEENDSELCNSGVESQPKKRQSVSSTKSLIFMKRNSSSTYGHSPTLKK